MLHPLWKIQSSEADFLDWWKNKNKVTIFFDGASKGNPRNAGASGLIFLPGGLLQTNFSWGLGQLSNNQVELYALLKSCQLTTEAGHSNLQIFGDSELIIKVLNSASKFFHPSLNVTMHRLHFILIECMSVSSFHILHELNKSADLKANQGCLLPQGMLSLMICQVLCI